jgi:hypothetical protein
MNQVELSIPQSVLDLLPGDDNAAKDIERAVEGYERHVNRIIGGAATDAEAAAEILNVLDHMEDRMETYDDFVPELRAWGQSPAYAIAWRNLHGSLIEQLYDHEISTHIERERNYRIAEDGIRLRDLKED